ncbi:hypothetical protein F0562_035107 [Nyssa sinensis]|uniref:Beta-amyrin 28-oxidase n=1 Tax=Nyssa sinensis TaxID=561372 RepID=A0A5J5ACM2_9ASTE|nr:hypothetical protein F0562_035107 [Nyssa sinensis]
MELPFLFLSLILASTPLILISFVLKRILGPKIHLPPGSFGWPFFGETLQFLFGKPEKFVQDRMMKHSSHVFKTKIFGERVAVVCGPSGNKLLFANEQKLVTEWRPPSMQKLLRSYETTASAPATNPSHEGDRTKVLRSPGFLKPEALARFMAKMDSIAKQHLSMHWEGNQEVVVFPLAKQFTLAIASGFFLGIQDHDRLARLVPEFDSVSQGGHTIPLNFPGTTFYYAKKAAAAIRQEIQLIIKEKKEALNRGVKMQDILTYMIVASDASGRFMPETEIADKIMGLLIAGYITVATAITFLMKYVEERPEIYDKIFAEHSEIAKSKNPAETLDWEDIQKMKYSWNVTSEVMRLNPPLQGTFREALTDISFQGFTIPKGWKLYWTISSTNKNPEYFPNPEEFNPMRYDEDNTVVPYTYVPFGGGPRLCPGKDYARVVILTFLHNVVKKFKWEKMVLKEKIISDMNPMPAQGFPIRLLPHHA